MAGEVAFDAGAAHVVLNAVRDVAIVKRQRGELTVLQKLAEELAACDTRRFELRANGATAKSEVIWLYGTA